MMLGRTECKIAVIALIEGFCERIARRAIGRGGLVVAEAWSAGDVDRTATQVIAVGNAADGAIMFGAAIGAGHLAPVGAKLLDATHIDRTAAALLLHCPCPGGQRIAARGLGRRDWFAELADAPIGIGRGGGRSKTKQKQCDPRSHPALP